MNPRDLSEAINDALWYERDVDLVVDNGSRLTIRKVHGKPVLLRLASPPVVHNEIIGNIRAARVMTYSGLVAVEMTDRVYAEGVTRIGAVMLDPAPILRVIPAEEAEA